MFKVTTNRIIDVVRVSEGSRHVDLSVDVDPRRVVMQLRAAQERLKAVSEETDSTSPCIVQSVTSFAAAVFGAEQAEKLVAFYGGDAAPALSVCTQYINRRLTRKIRRAQRAGR